MYREIKENVERHLLTAKTISLTTDTWTSVVCDSYMTVTVHFLEDWKFKSYVLSTTCTNERHTADNLKAQLDSVISQWNLGKNQAQLVVTTDNAANIKKAVNNSTHNLRHIGCFAHTLNLVAQQCLKVEAVSAIVNNVKRIVGYFHRSTTAKGVLSQKQDQLSLNNHRLVNDVPTRWNSTYMMLERFAEQRPAIFAALEALKNTDLVRVYEQIKSSDVETIMHFLKPYKTATDVMSGSSYATVSLIKPLMENLMTKCIVESCDCAIARDMKMAAMNDLEERYNDADLTEYLYKCSCVDPRFKCVKGLNEDELTAVFTTISLEIVELETSKNTQLSTAFMSTVGDVSEP